MTPFIIGSLLKLAPAAIRLFAKARGKEEIGNLVADAVISAQTVPKNQMESVVAGKLARLSADQLTDILRLEDETKVQIRLAEEDSKRRQEETHQTQLNTESLEAKRIRPKIAKQSWLISAAYAILTTLALPILTPYVVKLPTVEFEWIVFVALFSPAATFMGIRGMERWKAGGTPS